MTKTTPTDDKDNTNRRQRQQQMTKTTPSDVKTECVPAAQAGNSAGLLSLTSDSGEGEMAGEKGLG